MSPILEWLSEHPGLLRAAAITSVATFVASLVGLPLLVAALPADYFAERCAPPDRFATRHPVLRAIALLVKNTVGAVLLVCGLAMLVIPGQGILTILVGLSLMNFPGKRRLELAIVRQRRVHAALDWIRRRAHRPPLAVYDPHAGDVPRSPEAPDAPGASEPPDSRRTA
jgi:hypothetical protein